MKLDEYQLWCINYIANEIVEELTDSLPTEKYESDLVYVLTEDSLKVIKARAEYLILEDEIDTKLLKDNSMDTLVTYVSNIAITKINELTINF